MTFKPMDDEELHDKEPWVSEKENRVNKQEIGRRFCQVYRPKLQHKLYQ